MASQYRCEVKWPLKRSKGQSAVAKAAYNSRSQLANERDGGYTRDYGKADKSSRGKEDILFSGIFVDPKINAPDWVKDRGKLWNAAVKAQGDRKNALDGAQEMIVNLPNDLDLRSQIRMLTDFVRENITRGTGRIADVNIHDSPKTGDDRNVHAHILFTIRKMGPDGFIAGDEGKIPQLKPEDIERLRLKWAERGARELERIGLTTEAERWREGHLTNERQAKKAHARGDHEYAEDLLGREKTEHLGPVASMDRKGQRTHKGQVNDETNDRNSQRQWDRETKRDDKKRGRVAERIHNAYEESLTATDFQVRLEKDNLFVARVTKQDIELYGPDYSDPREELERLKWLQKRGAWPTGKDGLTGLNDEQKERAQGAYARHRDGRENPLSFEGYVKFVQLQNGRRMENLEEQAKTLDFAGGDFKKSDFRAREGEYVVLTKSGHVYRLNQATTGEKPSEVREFMKSLDGKQVKSVTGTREHLEAMRVTASQERASGRLENATRGHSKPVSRIADRALDRFGSGMGSLVHKTVRTLNILSKAMDSVADMFLNFFPQERQHERLLREEQERENQQKEYSRER
jgi:hypothetical protein